MQKCLRKGVGCSEKQLGSWPSRSAHVDHFLWPSTCCRVPQSLNNRLDKWCSLLCTLRSCLVTCMRSDSYPTNSTDCILLHWCNVPMPCRLPPSEPSNMTRIQISSHRRFLLQSDWSMSAYMFFPLFLPQGESTSRRRRNLYPSTA